MPVNWRCSCCRRRRRCCLGSYDLHCCWHGPNDGSLDNLNSTLTMRIPFVMAQRCPNFGDPEMWPTVESMFHARHFPDPRCHDCCTSHTYLCRPQSLSTMTTMWTMSMSMQHFAFHYCCSMLSHSFPNYHRF